MKGQWVRKGEEGEEGERKDASRFVLAGPAAEALALALETQLLVETIPFGARTYEL